MNEITAGLIGASSESVYAIKAAQKRGIKVIAIDGDPDAEGLKYADQSAVLDISDFDLVNDFFTNNHIDFLLPIPVGSILSATGFINDTFRLPGVSYDSVIECTDKWQFHCLLNSKGLRKAKAFLVKSGHSYSADDFKDIDYPSIIKPRFGSGSRGVKLLNSYKDLETELDEEGIFTEDFVIESCCEGIEYGVDAIVKDNKASMVLLREKVNTPYPFRQCIGYYSVPLKEDNKELFDNINDLLSKIVSLTKINDCLMHADIIADDDNSPFVIEISPRPSGHFLHNCFTIHATGFNMLDYYLELMLAKLRGEDVDLKYKYNAASMFIKYFDFQNGKVLSVPDEEEIRSKFPIVEYECNIKHGDVMCEIKDGISVMGRGFFIVSADSLDHAAELCKEIENEFVIEN